MTAIAARPPSAPPSVRHLTLAEFFALPDDGLDRDLIRGEVRERPMTKRNRWHSFIVAQLSYLLNLWRKSQSGCVCRVYAGEVGCILRRNPDTTVGIDVAASC